MRQDLQVGLIAAVSQDFVIGVDGGIPWRYPADQRRFKEVTMGHPVVMGRLTWLSFPRRPLPGRRNLVITSAGDSDAFTGAECFVSLTQALAGCRGQVWVIGGGRLYTEAMALAQQIDLTLVPETIGSAGPRTVKFPQIDTNQFRMVDSFCNSADPRLVHKRYRRRGVEQEAR